MQGIYRSENAAVFGDMAGRFAGTGHRAAWQEALSPTPACDSQMIDAQPISHMQVQGSWVADIGVCALSIAWLPCPGDDNVWVAPGRHPLANRSWESP